ncbi:MAG: hypothetical protein WCR67_05855 [Bacilli bacterium]
MKKTPEDIILEFIQKRFNNERNKWECGLKNDYYYWDEVVDELTPYLARREHYEIKRKEND